MAVETGAGWGGCVFGHRLLRVLSHDNLQMDRRGIETGCRLKAFALQARERAAAQPDTAPGATGISLVNGKDPRQYGLDFGLWTRSIVAALIERKFNIALGLTARLLPVTTRSVRDSLVRTGTTERFAQPCIAPSGPSAILNLRRSAAATIDRVQRPKSRPYWPRVFAIDPAKYLLLLARCQAARPARSRAWSAKPSPDTRFRCRGDPFVECRATEPVGER